MFLSDYPRGLLNCFWLWGFSAFDPLPVALALPLPFLVAPRRFPVSLLRLPPRPLACPSRQFSLQYRWRACRGAKRCSHPLSRQYRGRGRRFRRPADCFLRERVGLSGEEGPMGGDNSQKLLPWRGIFLLSGAQ